MAVPLVIHVKMVPVLQGHLQIMWLSSACIIGRVCSEGTSNPDGFECQTQFQPRGTSCDDGAFCTVNTVCDGASWCGNGEQENPCDEVTDVCNDASCDEVNDVCEAVAKANGTACSDGDSCSVSDSCSNGLCLGANNICGEYKVSSFVSATPDFKPALCSTR